jgi:phosphoglycolate phosphatase
MLHSLSLEQPSQSLDIILFTSTVFNNMDTCNQPIEMTSIIYIEKILKEQNVPKDWKPLRNQENTQPQTTMQHTKLKAKGIFLDLDGTIIDSKEAYIEAARIASKATGKKAPPTEEALEIPKRIEQGLSIDDLIKGDSKKFLGIYFKAFYTSIEAKTMLFPNVSATLETLSAKHKLALITMRHVPNQAIQKELDCLGIAKYFTHVVTALDTSKPKPSPEALIQCVKALDLEMRDCIIAGDSVNDVRAGKAAGARTIALLSGLFGCKELAKECPDLILPNISSLPEFIE